MVVPTHYQSPEQQPGFRASREPRRPLPEGWKHCGYELCRRPFFAMRSNRPLEYCSETCRVYAMHRRRRARKAVDGEGVGVNG